MNLGASCKTPPRRDRAGCVATVKRGLSTREMSLARTLPGMPTLASTPLASLAMARAWQTIRSTPRTPMSRMSSCARWKAAARPAIVPQVPAPTTITSGCGISPARTCSASSRAASDVPGNKRHRLPDRPKPCKNAARRPGDGRVWRVGRTITSPRVLFGARPGVRDASRAAVRAGNGTGYSTCVPRAVGHRRGP